MTKKEAIEILDKELKCYRIDISACDNRYCEECENAVSVDDIHLAIEVALDILKEGEKDGE